MNWCRVLCILSIAIFGSACLAQDITDVEAKPYGSYSGGAIDSIDLATGNVMLDIPLISFPQLGKLPPLSFFVELNNAPYTQTSLNCNPDYTEVQCAFVSSRYDTSPPGAVYDYAATNTQNQIMTISYPCPNGTCTVSDYWGYEDGNIQTMGAYLASSFDGGIVTGQDYTPPSNANPTGLEEAEIDFSAVDASGTTHKLESDNSNWNTYRAPDGSGYSFVPSGTPISAPSGTINAYDPFNTGNGLGYLLADATQPVFWLENASDFSGTSEGGVRIGTLYSPTGIQYTDSVERFKQVNPNNSELCSAISPNGSFYCGAYEIPQALMSTETDPSGNRITRGPWYWSGYYSESSSPTSSPSSPFSDIDAIYSASVQQPQYVDSVGRYIPDVISMQATQYLWNWTHSDEPTLTWTMAGPENNSISYQITYTNVANIQSWQPQQNSFPDPSTDVEVSGWGISSIVLPNGTEWTFTYAGATEAGYSAGDLEEVTTPSGGSITYTYTTVSLPRGSVSFVVKAKTTGCSPMLTVGQDEAGKLVGKGAV